MSKKYSLIVNAILVASLLAPGPAFAQEDALANPGLLPDSPFYFLDLLFEGIGSLVGVFSSDEAKADRALRRAEERLAEASAVAEKGKAEKAEKALARYGVLISDAIARGEGRPNITEKVAEATAKHLRVLADVAERVPEEAKASIERALTVSERGRTEALRALAAENPKRATELNLRAAKDRLDEALEDAGAGDGEGALEALEAFEAVERFGEEISSLAQGLRTGATTVDQLVGRATSVHLEVLSEVLKRVPEQAKPAVERAIMESSKRHQAIVERLKERGDVDAVLEGLLIPEGVPDEVRKRIEEELSGDRGGAELPELPEVDVSDTETHGRE